MMIHLENAILIKTDEFAKPECKKIYLSTKGEITAMHEIGARVYQETRKNLKGEIYNVYFVIVRFSSLCAIAQ